MQSKQRIKHLLLWTLWSISILGSEKQSVKVRIDHRYSKMHLDKALHSASKFIKKGPSITKGIKIKKDLVDYGPMSLIRKSEIVYFD